MFFFSFIFYLFLFYPKHVYEQSYTHFLCFFFLFLVYDYLMVSVTSTLPFRDTLHFTITTTTTTTMTMPTTKPPPRSTTTTRPNTTTTISGANGTRDATASRVPGIFLLFSFLFFFFFPLLTQLYTIFTV